MGYEEELPIAVVGAFLCLGRKYDMKKLDWEARRRLYRAFPLTLEEDDARSDGIPGIKSSADIYVDILNIARRGEVFSILPGIFYAIGTAYAARAILKGWEIHGVARHFPSDYAATTVAGLDTMYDTQAQATFAWLFHPATPDPGCATPLECYQTRQATIVTNFTPTPVSCGLDLWEDCIFDGPGLCKSCTKKAKTRHTAGRQEFWELLPSFFDLPPWTELQKEREDLYVSACHARIYAHNPFQVLTSSLRLSFWVCRRRHYGLLCRVYPFSSHPCPAPMLVPNYGYYYYLLIRQHHISHAFSMPPNFHFKFVCL